MPSLFNNDFRCISFVGLMDVGYNNTPNRPYDDKWMISVSLLRELSNSGQSAVYVIYNARREEIEAHNQLHQLNGANNRKSPGSPSASEVIHID